MSFSLALPALTTSINALIIAMKKTHLNVSRRESTCSLQKRLLKVRDVQRRRNLLLLLLCLEQMDSGTCENWFIFNKIPAHGCFSARSSLLTCLYDNRGGKVMGPALGLPRATCTPHIKASVSAPKWEHSKDCVCDPSITIVYTVTANRTEHSVWWGLTPPTARGSPTYTPPNPRRPCSYYPYY